MLSAKRYTLKDATNYTSQLCFSTCLTSMEPIVIANVLLSLRLIEVKCTMIKKTTTTNI